ncbi:MAG: single-stranded DNA-binding protein [Bacteroidetes bacterium]|jgi:single-strand DNA-binding protein|nr:single-stranded DNA-binding protein [Bacteroidota bacterium]MBT6686674.1 single-stranded DNA-binding protein [Bacteroidota bacterium]MBT7144084.1 single-stranded DNA-binding protein [Bacteroidota bacterium]MBT7492273.1 single-stranded DNA-binding protein [Bacteroidota bacterium]
MINKVILIGNVGKEPEVNYLDNGVAVAKFSLATSESYKKDGEKVTITEWHNIVMWRKLAEICEKYVKKGDKLYVEGKISTRSWDDKDGNKRYSTEIVANNMTMLGTKSATEQNSQQAEPNTNSAVEENQDGKVTENTSPAGNNLQEETDDLPF